MIHESTINAILDEGLEHAAASVESFLGLPSAYASPDDVATVTRAIAAARAVGLRFVAPTVRFVFATGRARGQFERRRDDYVVTLNLAECPTLRDLAEVVWHECAHLHDLCTGQYGRMSVAERERRALDFAVRMANQICLR